MRRSIRARHWWAMRFIWPPRAGYTSSRQNLRGSEQIPGQPRTTSAIHQAEDVAVRILEPGYLHVAMHVHITLALRFRQVVVFEPHALGLQRPDDVFEIVNRPRQSGSLVRAGKAGTIDIDPVTLPSTTSTLLVRGGRGTKPLLLGAQLRCQLVPEILGLEDRPNLNFRSAFKRRFLEPLHGFVDGAHFPDPEACDQVLRIRERAIEHRWVLS